MMTNEMVVEKIKSSKNIALFAHRGPDPDACGSLFGLRNLCQNLGKNADVFVVRKPEGYLNHIFPLNETKENFSPENYDLVIIVDCHVLNLIDPQFQDGIVESNNVLIIDHHFVGEHEQEFLFKHDYLVQTEASCSQLILDLFRTINQKPTPVVAKYLYAGLIGDTSRFLHSNLSRRVFEDAICLQDCGADIQLVYDYMFRYRTKEQIRVNKFFLDNLKFAEDGRVGYVIFSEKDIRKIGVDIEDIKHFCNEIVKIKDVEASFLCIEKSKGHYKFSLRSVGDVEVLSFCNKMGGGGHPAASGFDIDISTRQVKREIPKWAKEILRDK